MTIEEFVEHARVEVDLIRQMRAGNANEVGTDEMTGATVSWSTTWRIAAVLSAVLAVLGAAMYHFLAVDRPVLVLLTAVVALTIGMRLPAIHRASA